MHRSYSTTRGISACWETTGPGQEQDTDTDQLTARSLPSSVHFGLHAATSTMDDATRKRIETVISPYTTVPGEHEGLPSPPAEPPPFTFRELVVFALALGDEPLTEDEIMQWIRQTFPFHRNFGRRAIWERFQPEERRQLLGHYDLPVIPTESDPVREVVCEEGPEGPLQIVKRETTVTKWSLQPNEARIHLRPLLRPVEQSKDPFRFLDLPPDIRNIIYTMVFAFPPAGVQINAHCRDHSGFAYAISRSFRQPASLDPWLHTENHIDLGKLSRLLALTATNRQIRSETLYLFATLNTFIFASATHMLDLLCRVPADQRDEIRGVAFFHHPGWGEVRAIPEIFDVLVTMKRLRSLRVCLDPWGFQRGYLYVHEGRVGERTGFDCATPLRREVEVVVDGDCEGEVGRAIRAEAVPKPGMVDTKLDCRPPVEKWWSVSSLVWALSLAPIGICIAFLVYTATLFHHSPGIATDSTSITSQTPLP